VSDAFIEPCGAGDGRAAAAALYARVAAVADDLATRWRADLPALPFETGAAAQAALDARNRRFSGRAPPVAARLESAEKAVESFFSTRVTPALDAARDAGVVTGAKAAATYARGLWDRLNGGGRRGAGGAGAAALAALPPLVGTKGARASTAASLAADVASAERRLQDASKEREARLRKASPGERATLARELRGLDDTVDALSRLLALRSLQLEMEAVYGYLEDEALDVAQALGGADADAGFLVFRQGSSEELALIAAEFGLLDGQLATVAAACGNGTTPPPPGDNDAVVETLAREVPDLRRRLAIGDDAVFGAGGLSPARVKAALAESSAKVADGALFFARGLRLLSSDVAAACGLFTRAAAGASLKPREVASLRRTARDVATFVPFTAILVTPLTPVGHVLVFGFLQRYFPGFFPSQFTSRRQELMMRYEELKKELAAAQEVATQEADAAELARAAAAVARLTAPKVAATARDRSDDLDEGAAGPAAAAVKALEGRVAAAEEEVAAAEEAGGGEGV
jgi:hypothetical protein